jgi:putative nucleotidyltransferase with HDIG domain
VDPKAIDYKNIPVQSDIIAGIVRLDVESNTCFRDLDSYVHSDQGVATLVLRVVNSALYSRGNKIATIPRAISVLGFQVVRSLAMLAFSRALFAQTTSPLFRTHIWQHSLLTAIAAQTISRSLGDGKQKDEAFIAGLMHDMGKVLLFTNNPDKYLEVLRVVLAEKCPSAQAEQRVFGCDHYQVGIEAVSQWRLPERFIDFMGTSLSPQSHGGAEDHVRLSLAAANCLIGTFGIGASALVEIDERRFAIMSYGFSEYTCEPWLHEQFLTELMNNETYQLCANI